MEQAQERAKEAIGAQKQGNDNRYFIRQLKDDRLVLIRLPAWSVKRTMVARCSMASGAGQSRCHGAIQGWEGFHRP